ncbi:MAG: type IX secretion system protein PorQ [Chitinophagales bacterium]|nr:type IX secretion system protein PorQ [Chitinophagales bacterium]
MKINYTLTLVTLIILSAVNLLRAQVGGEDIFHSLNISPSSRVTAMGGNFMSMYDEDASLGLQNPSVINPLMNNHLNLSYINYLADLKAGYVGYVHEVKKIQTTFNGGIQFIDYGDFVSSDIYGNSTGTFNGAEYAITLGAARTYAEKFHYGMNLTYVTSRLESYSANGLAVSFAGSYHDSAEGLTATVAFKNVGTQFKSYLSDNNEALPFDIQAGISKRVTHTPFLFSLVLHDLSRWDIRYNDPNAVTTTTILLDTTQQQKDKKYIADKIFLHTIIGAEIYFGEAFRISLAYNHQRRQELAYENRKALSGFSFGAGLKINRYSFSYARAIYNAVDGVNQFSIAVNLDELFGKKM